jgi:hypothetical protein
MVIGWLGIGIDSSVSMIVIVTMPCLMIMPVIMTVIMPVIVAVTLSSRCQAEFAQFTVHLHLPPLSFQFPLSQNRE